jgi:tRNA(fMet)-specific endonuclease VapC
MTAARPVVYDTSMYVAAIRGGPECDAVRIIRSSVPRTHLAAPVAAELQAGVLDTDGHRAVAALVRAAQRVGRLVSPTFDSWLRAGEALAAIRRREPHLTSKLPKLWNDLLIALSATQIGGTIVTANRHDFELARRYVSFDLVVEQP